MADRFLSGPEEQGTNGGEPDGFDLEKIRNMAGFALRAARRRPLLAAATFLIVSALGFTVSLTMPRIYSAEVRLLAQKSNTMHALSSSNAREIEAADNPTKDVAAMIMRRDNLVALVRDAHLLDLFKTTRSPALRLKDRVMAFVFGTQTDEERELGLVHTLEKRLMVDVDQDTVNIRVYWSDARTAYDLVTLVQRYFLEARYGSDVTAINDSIAVLEDHAKKEHENVDTALDEYQKLIAERTAALPLRTFAGADRSSSAPAGPAASSLPAEVDPALVKGLEDKRVQIKNLEDTRQHVADSLRRQLAEAQLTLTSMHPTVVALHQQVEAMSQPSPELVQLRSEERALMAKVAARAQPTGTSTAPVPFRLPATSGAGSPGATALTSPLLQHDGPLELGQSKLAAAAKAYEESMARLDAARIELDITRTSYKHRYTVLVPAEIPGRPAKPIAQIVGVGAVFIAGLLALLLTTAADLFGGLVLESWQVKQRLKLDILGEFNNPT